MSELRKLINSANDLIDAHPVDVERLKRCHEQLTTARENTEWPSASEIKNWERDCVEADEVILLIEIIATGKGVAL